MGDVLAFPGSSSPGRPVWLDRLDAGRKALVIERDGSGCIVRMLPAVTEIEQAVWARYDNHATARAHALRATSVYPDLYQFVVDHCATSVEREAV